MVATGLEETFGVLSWVNRRQKRRFYDGFLTTANNEKQFCTTRVGVRVGVRKTSCIALLSVRLSNKINLKDEVITMTNLKKEIAENGIHYTLHGDYYFPDPGLLETSNQTIGHYGRMRKAYLGEHRPGLYERLLLSGKLYEHLAEIDTCCSDRMERMIRQMADAEGINEDLKARNQLAWVGRMNNIRQQAEEMILNELIYA